jgi:hypothetical protein
MQGSPTAFEITKGGAPGDASWTLNGSQMQISLGTLQVVRMIIITTDATLRTAVQSRYDKQHHQADDDEKLFLRFFGCRFVSDGFSLRHGNDSSE